MSTDRKEVEAAELLLERAKRERDEIESRIAWLESLGARLKSELPSGQDSGGDDDDDGDVIAEGYGGMKRAVHTIMVREGKRLKIPDIADLILREGIREDRKGATSTARNAIRALLKSQQVKRMGSFYKAL
jgi:hypothetical protein